MDQELVNNRGGKWRRPFFKNKKVERSGHQRLPQKQMSQTFFKIKMRCCKHRKKVKVKRKSMQKNEITIQQQPTPATLLEKAIEKGADISQLKELMDLQERWEKKEAKKSFLDAMSLFQTKIPELKKTKTAL